MCFDFLYKFCPKHLSFKKGMNKIIVFTLSTCYSCPILIKLEFSRLIFQKYPNIKFQENPSSGSRVLPHRQTDGHKDMTNLTVAFCKFVNVPKKGEGLQPRPEETYSASMFLNLLWQSSYWLKPPLLSPSYSFDYPCSFHPACVIKLHNHTYHISMKINSISSTLKMVAAHSS